MYKSVFTLLLLGGLLAAHSQYIPQTNKATLALVREEQKLARDVYDSLYHKWDLRLFGEIGGVEGTHMEAVKPLLEQFAVADPVAAGGDAPGRFVHHPFQKLYESLVVSGGASVEGALRAGAYVAEKDILDLQRAVQATASEDLRAIYKYLQIGSQRHLLTLARYLKKRGVVYEPVLLHPREYERLIGASGGGTE